MRVYWISAIAATALGLLIASQLGPAMLNPVFLLPFSLLSAFLAGQAVLSSNGDLRIAIARAAGFLLLTLAVALVLVNIDPPHDRFPDWRMSLALASLCLAAAWFAAGGARAIAQRWSPNVAAWTLRFAMAGLYVLYRFMPFSWTVWILDQIDTHGVLMPSLLVAAMLAVPAALLTFKKP